MSGNFFGGFEVGIEGGFLDITAAGGAGGVDIDGDQCLGGINDNRATGGQANFALEGSLYLALDLEAVEQGDVVLVQLDAVLYWGMTWLTKSQACLKASVNRSAPVRCRHAGSRARRG